MATAISSRSYQIVLKGYNSNYVVERKVNGSDEKPGHIVTGVAETFPDIDLCAAGEGPLGILLEHYRDDGLAGTVRDTPDIDTVFTDNAVARVALIGSGMTCLTWLGGEGATSTAAVYPGTKLVVGQVAGSVSHPTFSTTTAELGADFKSLVGVSIEYNAGGNTTSVIAVII